MNKLRLGIAVFILSMNVVGCSRIDSLNNYSHTVGAGFNAAKLSDKEIGIRISKAAMDKKWACNSINNNQLMCTLNVRDHEAAINIDYTQTGYSIAYVSSKNLMYNKTNGTIHRNYIKWIKLLRRSIDRAMSMPA
jgi:hypothetical protein